MFTPKLFLIFFFYFTLQNFILQEGYQTQHCKGIPLHTSVITPNICKTNNGQSFEIFKVSEKFYTLQGNCDRNCSICEVDYKVDFTCDSSKKSSTFTKFGNPREILQNGFVIEVFFDGELCRKDTKGTDSTIFHDGKCLNGTNKYNMDKKIKSLKMYWNKDKKGVIFERYHNLDCQGEIVNSQFFSKGNCEHILNSPPSMKIKVRKNF